MICAHSDARTLLTMTLLLAASSGCSDSKVPTQAAAPPASSKIAESSVSYCSMFTPQQIGAALGKPVNPGSMDPAKALDGCEWQAADGKGTVLIQVLPAGMWNDLSGGTGQHPVAGVGEKAYIGPSPLGGVQAGAVAGESFYMVRMDPAPADDIVTGVLKDFIGRSNR